MTLAPVRSRWTAVAAWCHTDRMQPFQFVTILSTLILAACGPCDDVVVLPGDEPPLCIPDSSGGGEQSSGDDSAGADPEPLCGGEMFGVGEDFGPCSPDGGCLTKGTKCKSVQAGNVCTPICGACSIGDLDGYDACLDELVCGLGTPACVINCANGQQCTVGGMVCDAPSGLCVWPADG